MSPEKPNRLRRQIEVNGRWGRDNDAKINDKALKKALKSIPSVANLSMPSVGSIANLASKSYMDLHRLGSAENVASLATISVAPAQGGSGFGAKGSALQAEIDYQRQQDKKYAASGKVTTHAPRSFSDPLRPSPTLALPPRPSL